MSHSRLAVLLLLMALTRGSQTLPVSSNHRFALYTPYWHQSSQSSIPPEFVQTRPNCEITLCHLDYNLLPFQSRSVTSDATSPITNMKRNNNLYKTGWTLGGLPFSVLYMHPKPQVTVRSQVTRPLPSLPHTYDSGKFPNKAGFLNYPPAVQPQPVSSGRQHPVVIPTRKQYSIIPQLFVSYGWGPLTQ